MEKTILFSLWVLAKPECFLAAGDRFGFGRSTAHFIFKEFISTVAYLLPQFIIWPQNHVEAPTVRFLITFKTTFKQIIFRSVVYVHADFLE